MPRRNRHLGLRREAQRHAALACGTKGRIIKALRFVSRGPSKRKPVVRDGLFPARRRRISSHLKAVSLCVCHRTPGCSVPGPRPALPLSRRPPAGKVCGVWNASMLGLNLATKRRVPSPYAIGVSSQSPGLPGSGLPWVEEELIPNPIGVPSDGGQRIIAERHGFEM